MGRYNSDRRVTSAVRSYPLRTVAAPERVYVPPTTTTRQGGPGYENDKRGELFRLGVNMFAGEGTYYETISARDDRFTSLVAEMATYDPAWTLGFLRWLRWDANIRTASVLGAVVALHARLQANSNDSTRRGPGYNRRFIAQIPARLDEVGEIFAAWQIRYGKPFPQALKRGAADALERLANEYSVMKWDTQSHNWRLADILGITHAKPANPTQEALYDWSIANRYGNSYYVDQNKMPMVSANINMRWMAERDPSVLLNPSLVKSAGFTWQDVLSIAGSRVPKARLWESLIMSDAIGYEALLKNLRNFEQAGISNEAVQKVLSVLTDPERVARSRQFPFRFWTAYKNTSSMLWNQGLETALSLSTSNVPEMPGRSLILVDVSRSMDHPMSTNSTIMAHEAGALFGAAVAQRNAGRADLHVFASRHSKIEVPRNGSVLRLIDSMTRHHNVGQGTETIQAIADLYRGHDRVMIFTDMQSYPRFTGPGNTLAHGRTIDSLIPTSTFVYAWDLRGYRVTDIPSGVNNRYQLGGLTDGMFNMIPLVEAGRAAKWPWIR